MKAQVGADSYGKDGVRLVLVRRLPDRHELRDLTVDLRLEGEFATVYSDGDNSAVLPTDTMRSTVYALAKEHLTGDIEEFGRVLAERLLTATPAARSATVSLTEHRWCRIAPGGRPHPHAFTADRGADWTARVVAYRFEPLSVTSGISRLVLLRTTGSSFTGFRRDEYTVLPETDDRILATELTATWEYRPGEAPAAGFDACREGVRTALLNAFAGPGESRSVQHTLYVLGQAALTERAEIARITLRMPNLHHLTVDLSPFGQANDNEVFVATDRPYGVIEGTIERSD